jgi:hypothetical protein
LILGVFVSYRLTDKHVYFWKSSSSSSSTANNSSIFYKGGIIVYLIYVIALIARLSIELIFIGPSAFTFSVATLSETAILSTAITDILLSFGIGLLVGRNVRVYQRYKLIIQGKEKVAAP